MLAQVTEYTIPPPPANGAAPGPADVVAQIMSTPGIKGFLNLRDGDCVFAVNFWSDMGAFEGYLPVRDRVTRASADAQPAFELRSRRLFDVLDMTGVATEPATDRTVAEVTAVFGVSNEQAEGDSKLFGAAVAAFDGCEGWITLRDRACRDGLVISLWRDRGAFDNFVPARDAMVAQAGEAAPYVIAKGNLYRVTLRA